MYRPPYYEDVTDSEQDFTHNHIDRGNLQKQINPDEHQQRTHGLGSTPQRNSNTIGDNLQEFYGQKYPIAHKIDEVLETAEDILKQIKTQKATSNDDKTGVSRKQWGETVQINMDKAVKIVLENLIQSESKRQAEVENEQQLALEEEQRMKAVKDAKEQEEKKAEEELQTRMMGIFQKMGFSPLGSFPDQLPPCIGEPGGHEFQRLHQPKKTDEKRPWNFFAEHQPPLQYSDKPLQLVQKSEPATPPRALKHILIGSGTENSELGNSFSSSTASTTADTYNSNESPCSPNTSITTSIGEEPEYEWEDLEECTDHAFRTLWIQSHLLRPILKPTQILPKVLGVKPVLDNRGLKYTEMESTLILHKAFGVKEMNTILDDVLSKTSTVVSKLLICADALDDKKLPYTEMSMDFIIHEELHQNVLKELILLTKEFESFPQFSQDQFDVPSLRGFLTDEKIRFIETEQNSFLIHVQGLKSIHQRRRLGALMKNKGNRLSFLIPEIENSAIMTYIRVVSDELADISIGPCEFLALPSFLDGKNVLGVQPRQVVAPDSEVEVFRIGHENRERSHYIESFTKQELARVQALKVSEGKSDQTGVDLKRLSPTTDNNKSHSMNFPSKKMLDPLKRLETSKEMVKSNTLTPTAKPRVNSQKSAKTLNLTPRIPPPVKPSVLDLGTEKEFNQQVRGSHIRLCDLEFQNEHEHDEHEHIGPWLHTISADSPYHIGNVGKYQQNTHSVIESSSGSFTSQNVHPKIEPEYHEPLIPMHGTEQNKELPSSDYSQSYFDGDDTFAGVPYITVGEIPLIKSSFNMDGRDSILPVQRQTPSPVSLIPSPEVLLHRLLKLDQPDEILSPDNECDMNTEFTDVRIQLSPFLKAITEEYSKLEYSEHNPDTNKGQIYSSEDTDKVELITQAVQQIKKYRDGEIQELKEKIDRIHRENFELKHRVEFEKSKGELQHKELKKSQEKERDAMRAAYYSKEDELKAIGMVDRARNGEYEAMWAYESKQNAMRQVEIQLSVADKYIYELQNVCHSKDYQYNNLAAEVLRLKQQNVQMHHNQYPHNNLPRLFGNQNQHIPSQSSEYTATEFGYTTREPSPDVDFPSDVFPPGSYSEFSYVLTEITEKPTPKPAVYVDQRPMKSAPRSGDDHLQNLSTSSEYFSRENLRMRGRNPEPKNIETVSTPEPKNTETVSTPEDTKKVEKIKDRKKKDAKIKAKSETSRIRSVFSSAASVASTLLSKVEHATSTTGGSRPDTPIPIPSVSKGKGPESTDTIGVTSVPKDPIDPEEPLVGITKRVSFGPDPDDEEVQSRGRGRSRQKLRPRRTSSDCYPSSRYPRRNGSPHPNNANALVLYSLLNSSKERLSRDNNRDLQLEYQYLHSGSLPTPQQRDAFALALAANQHPGFLTSPQKNRCSYIPDHSYLADANRRFPFESGTDEVSQNAFFVSILLDKDPHKAGSGSYRIFRVQLDATEKDTVLFQKLKDEYYKIRGWYRKFSLKGITDIQFAHYQEDLEDGCLKVSVPSSRKLIDTDDVTSESHLLRHFKSPMTAIGSCRWVEQFCKLEGSQPVRSEQSGSNHTIKEVFYAPSQYQSRGGGIIIKEHWLKFRILSVMVFAMVISSIFAAVWGALRGHTMEQGLAAGAYMFAVSLGGLSMVGLFSQLDQL